MTAPRDAVMQPGERIGLTKAESAAYIGVSVPLFERLVSRGSMPKARRFGDRPLWSRFELERAFVNFPSDDENQTSAEENEWAV